ncbi:N-acetylmuramoyl-L-alanine amidase [Streptacidiphilus fuscans]|uniref:N-acetylmuramoyl-L-alanine amidase n=1 Tax=Streptacidiphilus fuscans TaxID=2789292 RepID=A0A931B8I9_9ACTN|nr:N-acetylmuramoyl-L-alanine amidase [Streptacidiphilus fuscans]MBF9073079.1 N-acetylmuramoyl-L-alanine amidase [Streptacidiphilus fuscans]
MNSDHQHDDDRAPLRQRSKATTLVLVLSALVPLCFAGWLGWQAFAGERGTATASGARPSAGTKSGTPSGDGATKGGASAPASAAGTGAAGSGTSGSGAAGTAAKPLAGKVIVIDPGHNPNNVNHPSEINSLVFVGNGSKACDTTGASTDAGYPEADFTLDVSRRVRTLLEAEGAKVIFTQDGDTPWGPCVTQRAAVGNQAHANAAISIHADGAGPTDYGFHVIMPALVDQGSVDNQAIVAPSHTLGMDVRSAFASATGEHYATYINGGQGYDIRSDLGGLNLSTVPKVFIECANMRDADDAAKVTSATWRQLAAQGIAEGLSDFVLHEGNTSG